MDRQFNPCGPEAAVLPSTFDSGNLDIGLNEPFPCQSGTLPPSKVKSPAEARQEAASRSSSIVKNFDLLRGILDRHQIAIQKRWTKKSREQRRAILLAAWGNDMSTTHRPDFQAFRSESPQQRKARTQYRQAFLWPFINQEDLTKPRVLPLLLHARGRHNPVEFVATDTEAIWIGVVTKALVADPPEEHVMLFKPQADAKGYARVFSLDDFAVASEWFSSGKQLAIDEGLLVLEAQDKVLSFLVSCTVQILRNTAPDSLLASPIQPKPKAPIQLETAFQSLTATVADAPYQPPAHTSFARIERLLAAKREACADHMWSLREDPGYFSNWMHEAKEHCQELMLDTNGKEHPVFGHDREDILWSRILSNEIIAPYLQLEFWTDLHTQASDLMAMHEAHARNLSPGKDLPDAYMKAIIFFRFGLIQLAKAQCGQLRVCTLASPPLRAYFARQPVTWPPAPGVRIYRTSEFKLDKVQSETLWLLRTLFDDREDLYSVGMIWVVDELQRLVDSEARAKGMISPYIASQIADLSILCECLRQLNLYQPWARTYGARTAALKDEIKEDSVNRSETSVRILAALRSGADAMVAYGTPTRGKFHYPVNERRTRENVDAMRRAEAILDLLWDFVDDLLVQQVDDLTDSAVFQLLSQPRILQRTPVWVEPINGPNNVVLNRPRPLNKPLSKICFAIRKGAERTTQKKSGSAQPQAKAETRGKQPPSKTASGPSKASDSTNSQPRFLVDKRALKVFRTLFYIPTASNTPGDVSWSDFLHAMTSTGFILEKLYSSLWQFSPTKLDVDTPIQIREPHPDGKIPFRMVRRHGRRLNRAYGWSGEMFGLAENNSAGSRQ